MQTLAHKFRAALQLPRNRMVAVAFAVAATVVLGMLLARNAHAQSLTTELGATLAIIIGYGAFQLAGFFGMVLLKAVEVLIWVASYQGFVTATPVVTGWVIVRDIANMFFILALLIIAFGTILGIDKYSYRNKQLSRLLLMAVLVNFSRTIAGLIIDFSQVVMLTFVNGFGQAAGGNFMTAFRINELYATSPTLVSAAIGSGISTEQASIAWGSSISMILALVMTVVALSTVIIMTVVLLWRIVMLWLLVIMSPLAFFMGGVPGDFAGGYYSQWWKDFKSQVVVGPFLAFFLWLALVSVASGDLIGAEPEGFGESIGPTFSAAFNSKSIGSFAVAIALMLGGVKMAQSMSSAVGDAKGMMSWAKKTGTGLAKDYGVRAALGKKEKDPRTGKERYRGGLLTTNVPLTAGVGMALGKVLGGGGYINKDRYRSDLYREATDMENRGDAVGAAKRRNKADELGKSFKDQSGGQKVATVLGKVAAVGTLGILGGAGSLLRKNAMDSQHTKYGSADLVAARVGAKGLPPQEQKDRALGKIGGKAADRAANIIEAVKAGQSFSKVELEEMKDFMSGFDRADSASMTEFNKALRDNSNYWESSDRGVTAGDVAGEMAKEDQRVQQQREDLRIQAEAAMQQGGAAGALQGKQLMDRRAAISARSPEEIRAALMDQAAVKAIENGKVKVTEDTSGQTMTSMAPAFAQASAGAQAKFMEGLKNDEQKAALLSGVTALRDEAPQGTLTPETLDKLSSAIASLSKEKDGGMGAAFGMKGGQFTDTLNSAGATLRTAAENADAFSRYIAKAKNADKVLLKVGSEQFNKPDGSMSEVSEVIAKALSDNPTAMSNAARNAEGEAQVKTMRAIVETAMKAGSPELKQSVDKGRAYESFGGGRDLMGKAKEEQRQASETARQTKANETQRTIDEKKLAAAQADLDAANARLGAAKGSDKPKLSKTSGSRDIDFDADGKPKA